VNRLLLSLLFAALSMTAQVTYVAPPRLGPAPNTRYDAGIAASRDLIVAVWSDSACGGTCIERITPDGTRLDVPPRSLSSVSNFVASDGNRFLIAARSYIDYKTHLVFLDRDGAMQELPATFAEEPIGLAGGADSYMLLLRQYDNKVLAVRLRNDGSPAGTPAITDLPYYNFERSLAVNDAGTALALVNGASIIDVRSSPRTRTSIGTEGFYPSLASDGKGFLAVWMRSSGNPMRRWIIGQELDDKGMPVGASVAIPADDLAPYGEPFVTWTGREYRIAWINYEGSRHALWNAAWNRDGVNPIRLVLNDATMKTIGIAGVQGRAVPLWSDSRYEQGDWTYRHGNFQFYATVADAQGALPAIPPDGLLISETAAEQVPGPITWCGDSAWVAWGERGGPQRVRISRFHGGRFESPDGLFLPLGDESQLVDQEWPALSCGARTLAMAWLETPRGKNVTSSVRVALFDRSDPAAEPKIVALAAGADLIGGLTAAFDGERHVFAWRTASNKMIAAARVSEAAFALDPQPLLLTDTGPTANGDLGPLLAWNGREFLLAWQHLPSAPSPYVTVTAWRFTHELTPLSLPARIASAATIVTDLPLYNPRYVALTASGDQWVLSTTGFFSNVAGHVWDLGSDGLPRRDTPITPGSAGAVAQNGLQTLVAKGNGVLAVQDGVVSSVFNDKQLYVWSVTGGSPPLALVTNYSGIGRAGVVALPGPARRRMVVSP